MNGTTLTFLTGVFSLLLLVVLSGCSGGDTAGGGSGDTAGGGGGDADRTNAQVSASSIEVINRVLDILLGDDSEVRQLQMETITRQEAVSVTLSCSTGEVSFNGEAFVDEGGSTDSFSIDGTMNFDNCEGIAGSVALNSSGTIVSNQITIEITLNGTLNAEGCNIGFNQFSADTTANLSGIITSPIIGNGKVNATCDGESIACTLNNVNLEDQAAFEQSCINM